MKFVEINFSYHSVAGWHRQEPVSLEDKKAHGGSLLSSAKSDSRASEHVKDLSKPGEPGTNR